MKMKITCVHFVFGMLALLTLASCATGTRLNTQSALETEISGVYNVIFYGCNYFNDPETVVFLDKNGDSYTFEPFASDYVYKMKKGLPAKEALEAANHFPNCSSAFRNAQIRSIVASSGAVLGYEVRPLYHSFVFGQDDVLNVYYRLRDDKVIISVTLDPSIERMLREGAGRKRIRD